jgi:AcrR family transcriptional regulator
MARRTAALAAQTRDALLDAALLVFAERGFAAAQLEEIARRAEVTRGALYHHFSGKAELFEATLDERWEAVLGPAIEELTPPPPPVGLPEGATSVPPDVQTRHLDQQRRRLRGQLRSFVSTVLHLVEVDPRARALLRMSLSGDHDRARASAPPAPAAHRMASAEPLAGVSGASSWVDWERKLVALLGELEHGPSGAGESGVDGATPLARPAPAVEDRAHALIAGLLGHAVWVTLRGPGESSVVALADVLCESALPS